MKVIASILFFLIISACTTAYQPEEVSYKNEIKFNVEAGKYDMFSDPRWKPKGEDCFSLELTEVHDGTKWSGTTGFAFTNGLEREAEKAIKVALHYNKKKQVLRLSAGTRKDFRKLDNDLLFNKKYFVHVSYPSETSILLKTQNSTQKYDLDFAPVDMIFTASSAKASVSTHPLKDCELNLAR